MEAHGSNGAPGGVTGRVVVLGALAVLLVIDLAHGDGLNGTLVVVALAAWLIAGRHADRHARAAAAVLVPVSLISTGLALSESSTIIFSGTEVAALLCTAAASIRWYRQPIDAVVAVACSLTAVAVAFRAGEDLGLTVAVVAVLAVVAAALAIARRLTADRPADAEEEAAPAPPVPAYAAATGEPLGDSPLTMFDDPDATRIQPAVRIVEPDPDPEHATGNPFAVIRARAAELGRSGVKVLIELDPPSPPAIDWTPELSAAVVSIVQEGLTNVRLHALGATTVHLHFHLGEDHLDLRILDDGHGAPPSRPAGGLLQMQRQATRVAGKVRAGPSPQGGWEVRAVLPAIRRGAPTQA